MGLFTSKKQRQEQEACEVEAAATRTRAEAAARSRRDREAAWRRDRNAVLGRLRSARSAHAEAKRTYDRYAPGEQKTAAGKALNVAADCLASVEREHAAVDDFSTWSRNH